LQEIQSLRTKAPTAKRKAA